MEERGLCFSPILRLRTPPLLPRDYPRAGGPLFKPLCAPLPFRRRPCILGMFVPEIAAAFVNLLLLDLHPRSPFCLPFLDLSRLRYCRAAFLKNLPCALRFLVTELRRGIDSGLTREDSEGLTSGSGKYLLVGFSDGVLSRR